MYSILHVKQVYKINIIILYNDIDFAGFKIHSKQRFGNISEYK